jgi:hypothetical protein
MDDDTPHDLFDLPGVAPAVASGAWAAASVFDIRPAVCRQEHLEGP